MDPSHWTITGEGAEDTVLTSYPVFPGIELVFKDIHSRSCDLRMTGPAKRILEIEHCREGRTECQVGEDYFYLAPGDISIRHTGNAGRKANFPMSHYHGVSILIDLEKTPKCLSCLMEDVDVQPAALARKFELMEKSFFILRQNASIEHIFSEIYDLPESIKKGYLKVKVLEILLFLTGLENEREDLTRRRFSPAQVSLAKAVCCYLTEHTSDRVTIETLARRFNTSPTQLKSSFRGVYGISVQAFVRSQKMRQAAKLLRDTDRTVLDIAGEFGYANGSKFAGAFRSVMGVTPNQYRGGTEPESVRSEWSAAPGFANISVR